MAQTRKKRKRKHRGTPAGTIEARGRTSRPQAPKDARAVARERRAARRGSEPPTWRGSLNRAAVAALLFGVAVIVIFGEPIAQGATLAAVMVLLYWPMTYYTDLWLYRRRQRQAGAGDDARPGKGKGKG